MASSGRRREGLGEPAGKQPMFSPVLKQRDGEANVEMQSAAPSDLTRKDRPHTDALLKAAVTATLP